MLLSYAIRARQRLFSPSLSALWLVIASTADFGPERIALARYRHGREGIELRRLTTLCPPNRFLNTVTGWTVAIAGGYSVEQRIVLARGVVQLVRQVGGHLEVMTAISCGRRDQRLLHAVDSWSVRSQTAPLLGCDEVFLCPLLCVRPLGALEAPSRPVWTATHRG